MLDAFRYLLCSKLCWHNRPEPTKGVEYKVGKLKYKSVSVAMCSLVISLSSRVA